MVYLSVGQPLVATWPGLRRMQRPLMRRLRLLLKLLHALRVLCMLRMLMLLLVRADRRSSAGLWTGRPLLCSEMLSLRLLLLLHLLRVLRSLLLHLLMVHLLNWQTACRLREERHASVRQDSSVLPHAAFMAFHVPDHRTDVTWRRGQMHMTTGHRRAWSTQPEQCWLPVVIMCHIHRPCVTTIQGCDSAQIV